MKHPKLQENNFADALKYSRKAVGLSQEAFSLASSRTYISSLERGIKSPTLSKVDQLAEVLELHPLTLLTLAYLRDTANGSPENIFAKVQSDFSRIRREQ